jgi:hypothetical protein
MAADMTSIHQTSKGTDRFHVSGSKPIGTLLPRVTKAAFRKHSPASALLMADWPIIVGPALAATTTPRGFAGGTLTLGCTGPVALELQHLATTLIERINQHLGRAAVVRLRFVAEAARAPKAPVQQAPRPEPVPIDGLTSGPLRDALSRLGAAIRSNPA